MPHVPQGGQEIHLLVHREQLRLRRAVPLAVEVLVLVHVDDEDVKIAAAIGPVHQVPEILDIMDLAVLGLDPVAHIVVALLPIHRLLQNVRLDLVQVLGVDHALEAVPHVVPELAHRPAAEKMDHVLVRVEDLLVPLGIVDEITSRQPRGDHAPLRHRSRKRFAHGLLHS